ncbi:unnamed protein product [Calypogeia fissa]
MDRLKQPLRADDPLDFAALLRSSCGGNSGAHNGSFPIGSNLTCGPQLGSSLYGQSLYHGRQNDLEADSEFEEESTARMQSLVPSGLLQDDGREYQDNFATFSSGGERQNGSNLSGEAASRRQELLWRELHQSCASNGFVGARRDQSFDSDRLLSNENGFAGGHVPTLAGGYFPTPEAVFQHEEATRRANESALPAASLKPCVQVASDTVHKSFLSGSQPRGVETVNSQMINEFPEQLIRKLNLRDIEHALALRKQLDEMEAFYRNYIVERMGPRNIGADITADQMPFAERVNLYQQEGLRPDFWNMANSIEQSSLLQRNNAVLTTEALASLRNQTRQHGPNYPTSGGELERKRNDEFEFERLRNEIINWLILDARRQGINAELPRWSGFASPHPTAVDNRPFCSAAATSSDSTRASSHSAVLGPRSLDLRRETSCVRSRSLRNTPEKKPDGYPCNSFSPTRRKSTPASASPATKALIAQGAKSISVILKLENSASRGRSSYPASPSLSTGSPPMSPGSGSLSPIRPRRLNMSNTDALQLIPVENPSVELDVCNQGQFKTELCNNWQESQWCRYGEHCRFAHGVKELRCVLRHHRYKSVPCRMIMSGKECIYGHRCHYRHSLTEKELSLISEARVISKTSL